MRDWEIRLTGWMALVVPMVLFFIGYAVGRL
jgi:hypothetical protein